MTQNDSGLSHGPYIIAGVKAKKVAKSTPNENIFNKYKNYILLNCGFHKALFFTPFLANSKAASPRSSETIRFLKC